MQIKIGKLNKFYLPLSEWIYSIYSKDFKTKIIGLSGGQGAGKSTITGIFAGYVTVEPPCVDNVFCPNVIISFGTTAFSNYVVDFFDEDNQNTTFESNEIIESEADDIIDFSEGNPFGTF